VGANEDNAGIKLIVSAAAGKTLARISGRDREALLDKAAAPYAAHPTATPLRGHHDLVRLRQGDGRGICRADRAADTVILETVAHRREVYR
jgi:mRNA-degrading endonuclease RelE of RelBE toxin-antitoxin system